MKLKINAVKTLLFLGTGIFALPSAKAQSTLNNLTNSISISTLNTQLFESWPATAVVVIRRTGDLRAVTIPLNITGTALKGIDYLTSTGGSVTIPMGSNEVALKLIPNTDELVEGTETINIQILPSVAYAIQGTNNVALTIVDKSNVPNNDEVNRFLIQAAFGADPDEVAKVKTLGISGWIDDQITRPKGYIEPVILKRRADGISTFGYATASSFWTKVMRRTPIGQADTTDILRQRIAYSLAQIFVISQKTDALNLQPQAVANYYDRLIDGAFGNFRQILYDITMHPCMGVYLGHKGNKKPNPILNTFPDQNYAREIMQLFSIGLWQLNIDGSRKLIAGQPIPTYTNKDIPEFARVFTGLSWGGIENIDQQNTDYVYEIYNAPMRAYEVNHDTDVKKLLNGVVLPAGQNTMQDINAAIDNLFNHPNVGPFMARLLIQRLITSNPTPEYIARVATKFNNNGQGVRGDMGAVVKAILMDKEARDFKNTKEVAYGKMREPYMTILNLAKTFNAQNISNRYDAGTYMYDYYLQEIFQSPSVFNFYSPNYRAPGKITAMGKFSPEFQILTAVTGIELQNNLLQSTQREISRWGNEPADDKMLLNYEQELPLAGDVDALLRHLSSKMTGGTLGQKSFQIYREAVLKLPSTGNNWELERAKFAVYLVGASAEFNIQK